MKTVAQQVTERMDAFAIAALELAAEFLGRCDDLQAASGGAPPDEKESAEIEGFSGEFYKTLRSRWDAETSTWSVEMLREVIKRNVANSIIASIQTFLQGITVMSLAKGERVDVNIRHHLETLRAKAQQAASPVPDASEKETSLKP